MRLHVLAASLLALLLSGCTAPLGAQYRLNEFEGDATPRRVVIAVLDTGTVPHLPIFEDSDPSLPRMPTVPFETIPISRTGSVRERSHADSPLFENLTTHTLYHFGGTRLFAISFGRDGPPPTQDATHHGTATTYLAARESRDAVIVLIEVMPDICLDGQCVVHPSTADAMEWVAAQPWIDIASLSLTIPAATPNPHPSDQRLLAATERAAASGKLVVNAAGNYIMPPITDLFAGPPWVIAVGGVESRANGTSVLSSKAADVVGNFTDLVPRGLTTAMKWASGTSYATPIVAGTLANAMHILRANGVDPTPQQLRDALNATGTYFAPTDWDPTPHERGPFVFGYVNSASLPVATQAQMGWGYIDGSMAPEIARRVMEQDLAPPAEKAQAALVQGEWQRARELYWANWPR